MTTVGYGDRFPTTAFGRAIGAVLMVLGIALFGRSLGLRDVRPEGCLQELRIDVPDEINERLGRIEEAMHDLRDQDRAPRRVE